MKTNEFLPGFYGPFFLMALAIPVSEAALGVHWLSAAALGVLAALLSLWLSAREMTANRWMSRGRLVTIVLLLGYYLGRIHSCWPGRGAQYAVPAVLMLLAVYAMERGTNVAIRSANVLRYGMYAVLGLLLYTGIRDIKWQALTPKLRLPPLELGMALLLPLLARREGSTKIIPAAALAAAVSVISAGTKATTLYMYSQGLSIRGVTEHAESLTACAVTVGYYALLCYLLDCGAREMPEKKALWWPPAAAAAGYLLSALNVPVREEVYVILIVVFWVILPVSIELKRKLKNVKIMLDKR